jgi:hypothetical protein
MSANVYVAALASNETTHQDLYGRSNLSGTIFYLSENVTNLQIDNITQLQSLGFSARSNIFDINTQVYNFNFSNGTGNSIYSYLSLSNPGNITQLIPDIPNASSVLFMGENDELYSERDSALVFDNVTLIEQFKSDINSGEYFVNVTSGPDFVELPTLRTLVPTTSFAMNSSVEIIDNASVFNTLELDGNVTTVIPGPDYEVHDINDSNVTTDLTVNDDLYLVIKPNVTTNNLTGFTSYLELSKQNTFPSGTQTL